MTEFKNIPAMINMVGSLCLRRPQGWKTVLCPKEPTGEPVHCGDWCSLFAEPEHLGNGIVRLELCEGRIWKFHDFFDHRHPPKDDAGQNLEGQIS